MVVFFLFSFYFRFSSSWHPFPPSSIPHQSLPFLIIPIFSSFTYPAIFFPRRLEERARDGTARYDSRDERDGDGTGYHFFLEKKKKKPHLFVSLKQTLFSYIAQGSFSFPTFSFSSNCISLRLLSPTNVTYFLVTFPHSSLPPPLLSSHTIRVFLVSPFHFTYNPLYIITCPHNHFFHTYLPNL